MRSAFSSPEVPITATSQGQLDESYDLRGLNLVFPDQIMPKGESPYTINSRMYAREEGETRVAIRTRRGTATIGAPFGETLDAKNIAANTGDLEFSATRIIAQPFEAESDGALTRMAPEIKRGTNPTGHVLVTVCADNNGLPGQVLAESSILASDVGDAYAYLDAFLIDAPDVSDGTQYWLLLQVQDNGSGTYYVRQTADAGALDMESTNDAVSWSSLGVSYHFKSYVTPDNPVKGFTRRYPSNGNNRTLYAAAGSIYSAEDDGTTTAIDTGLNAGSEYVRFAFADDKSFYVNGINAPKKWDGTTVSVISGAPTAATHVIVHQGRLFFVTDKTLVRFSELYEFDTYPSVNFFYIPNPKSADPITGWRVFQDNLLIFTHETKYTIFGSDISSFTRKEAVGTKGAVSDEAIAVDRNIVYFMDDEGMIQAWNGATDTLISDKMAPEFSAIPNKAMVRLHLYKNQLRVYYQSPTSSYNDRMAIYDIQYKQWFMDTGKPLVGALEWNQDNNELIEFSSRAPWMLQGEQGYSDVGKPIDWKYWTNYKIYGSGATKKRVRRFRPIVRTVNADYTLLVGKDVDFNNTPDMREYIISGGGAKWGAFVWGDGTKWGKKKMVDKPSPMSGRGRHIQFRFERKGVETPVELYGYIAQIKAGRPK